MARPKQGKQKARASAPALPYSIASSFHATVNVEDGRLDEAERDVERAHEVDPLVPYYHLQLGRIALLRGDSARALVAYERERRGTDRRPSRLRRMEATAGLDMAIAQLHQRLGHRREAIRTYRRLLESEAYAGQARDSLRSLGAAP
jgi:tetratricopeptide (TPR) repeat protein